MAVLLAALAITPPGRAFGATTGATTGTERVQSGTWGVVATESSASPPPTGPLTVTVTTNTAFYFQVVNDGTVSLASITYSVAVPTANTTLALAVCSAAWVQGGPGLCVGTTTTVDTWSGGGGGPGGPGPGPGPGPGGVPSGTAVSSTTVPAGAGNTIYLRATPGGVPPGGTTFTINMSVGSTQLRPDQTTNS